MAISHTQVSSDTTHWIVNNGYPNYRVESHERANCASVIGR
jgi:hypothetical protein